MEDQTLSLMRYLADVEKNDTFDNNPKILTLSRAVDLTNNVDNFVVMSKLLLAHSKSKWMLAHIKKQSCI